jgi:tetratricopeptide (TPR) repeat protein
VVNSSSTLPDFDKLWTFNNPAATEAKFKECIESARKSGDTSYYLQLLTQIARAQGLQDKFSEAHATLDDVEKQLRGEFKVARIRYLLERGRVFNSSNHPDRAKPLFNEAWETANAANETRFAADALHMIGIVEPEPADKVKRNIALLEYIEKHPSERRWLDAVYNNLGEAYLATKDYQHALDSFQKLVALSRELGQEPWIYTQKDVSKCLRLLGRNEDALKVIQPVFDTLQKKGEADGWISGELGECLLALGKRSEAKKLFKQAYAEFSKDEWLMKHESEHINRIKKLGEE